MSATSTLGQNTGVGSCSLLQGISPTQGLNPGLPHCRWILYQLSHKGSPRILEWVAYPFSSGSSRGLLHCRWILYQLSYQGSPTTLAKLWQLKMSPDMVECLLSGRLTPDWEPCSVWNPPTTHPLTQGDIVCVAQSCPTPARLLCQWDSPSKNTGVGCHFLLQGIFLTRDGSRVSCTAGRLFTDWAMREARATLERLNNWYCVGCDQSEDVLAPCRGVYGNVVSANEFRCLKCCVSRCYSPCYSHWLLFGPIQTFQSSPSIAVILYSCSLVVSTQQSQIVINL